MPVAADAGASEGGDDDDDDEELDMSVEYQGLLTGPAVHAFLDKYALEVRPARFSHSTTGHTACAPRHECKDPPPPYRNPPLSTAQDESAEEEPLPIEQLTDESCMKVTCAHVEAARNNNIAPIITSTKHRDVHDVSIAWLL